MPSQAVAACGGFNQGACCLGETNNDGDERSCVSGLRETGAIKSWSCFGFLPRGTCGFSDPDNLSQCGGEGQRACCVGETEGFNPCDDGMIEVLDVYGGTCPPPSLFAGASAGTCIAKTCGHEGERACTVLDGLIDGKSCASGLIEIGGDRFGDKLLFGPSSGWCTRPTDCGGNGQRACCNGIGEYSNNSLACDAGLTKVVGVAGDSSCGVGNLVGNPVSAAHSCIDLRKSFLDYLEPTSGWLGATSVDSCEALSGKGYADLHVHMFGHLAHGGRVLAGKPYDENGGFVVALSEQGSVDFPEPGGTLPEACEGEFPAQCNEDTAQCDVEQQREEGDVLADEVLCGCDTPAPDYGSLSEACQNALTATSTVGAHGGHGIGGDALGFGTSDLKGAHVLELAGATGLGAPTFQTWPTWSSTTHQQMYYTWLERAWRGGLRLMVQFAVTNEALCISSGADEDGVDCSDEMGPVDAQLDATYAFEAFIDEKCQLNPGSSFCAVDESGAEEGWFRIVTDPVDAQATIEEGKLAVVLGIEVANLFDCKKDGCPSAEIEVPLLDAQGLKVPDLDENGAPRVDAVTGQPIYEMETRELTSEEYVQQEIDKYYNKGVRVIFPIHNFDNAFGGPATWQDAIHAGNRVSEGAWWDLEECGGQGYGLQLGSFLPWILNLFSFSNLDAPAIPAASAHCNKGGLTPLGITAIEYMMDSGILVDVDHMSNKALDATLDIAEEKGRPVIASHVQFFDLNSPSVRHERMRTREQLERIAALGGMVAAMLKDDQQEGNYGTGPKPYVSLSGNTIANDCVHSTKTWAQMYQYAVDVMNGPVAMGSDFNGVAGHVGPRFGFDACAQDHVQRAKQGLAGNRLVYPFELKGFGVFDKQVTGTRSFDFNNDGLAHVGLLPDMVADLRGIGLSDAELAPLFNSAVGFVNVWKRGEGVSIPLPSIDAPLGCQDVIVDANESCEADLDVSIADANTSEYDFPQTPPGPYPLGDTPVRLAAFGEDSCGNPLSSCIGTVTVVDNTPPTMNCPQPITAECAPETATAPVKPEEWPEELPWPYGGGDLTGTSVTFETGDIVADNCGGAEFAGCSVVPGHPFGFGETEVSCSGLDAAGNTGDCEFLVTIEDTTPPVITCPVDIVEECTGDSSAWATPGVADGADICAGVSLTSFDPASFPMGSTPLQYIATDEVGLTASCTSQVTVEDTTPPVITCPENRVEECTGDRGATVSPVDATATDICADVSVPNPGDTFFGMGTNTLAYLATDNVGLEDSCSIEVTIEDTTPPEIELVAAAPQLLWPANHEMTPINVTVTATDLCDNSVPVCKVTRIFSDEHPNATGDGNTASDWEWKKDQTGSSLDVMLRAEREGSGDGRTYTVEVTCADETGNTTAAETTVFAPKNNK